AETSVTKRLAARLRKRAWIPPRWLAAQHSFVLLSHESTVIRLNAPPTSIKRFRRHISRVLELRPMFLGHFGLGFAGKRIAPDMSLGSLFLAVQFADLLFWILALVGAEHFRISPGATRVTPMDFYDYPYSHSLVALAVWAAIVGAIYWIGRDSLAGGLVLAAGV